MLPMMTPISRLHRRTSLCVLLTVCAAALAGCAGSPSSVANRADTGVLITDPPDVLRQRLSMCALSYVVAQGRGQASVAYSQASAALRFESGDPALNRFMSQCMADARPGPGAFQGVLQINGGNPT